MKSVLLLFTLACVLCGVPPSCAAKAHRDPRVHLQIRGEIYHGPHLITAARLHRRQGHLKHTHYAMRHHAHSRATGHTFSQPVPSQAAPQALAESSVPTPNPITGLPLPPEGTPEFGNATVSAPSVSVPDAKTQTFHDAEPTPAIQPEQLARLEIVAASQEPALSAAPSTTTLTVSELSPPAAAPAEIATPTPNVLPTPVAPKARFNQPTAVPLPEPAAVDPATETSPIPVPEHEDDDQPIAATSGVGYIGLARTGHTRPFPTPQPMHGYDIAASGVGIFTHSLTATGVQSANAAAGLLLSVHHSTTHAWLDFEAHYGLNQNTAQYAAVGAQPAVDASILAQEFTADLLLRRHPNLARPYRMLPYVGVGGGLLYLRQSSTQSSQLAPAALLDSGIDIPTDSQHLSFRIGSHLLLYPTPGFGVGDVSGWTVSVQPAAGMLFHF